MSILISNATGSKDLAGLIEKRPGHPEVQLCSLAEMPYSDALITFNGPDDSTILVGVEIKTVEDALNCITTGRFAGFQLPGLAQSYDLIVLLLEGKWRMSHQTRILETLRGKFGWRGAKAGSRGWMFRDFNRWLLDMAIVGGVQVWTTEDRPTTVQTLIDIHELGQKKWEDHKSFRVHNRAQTDLLKYKTLPNGRRQMRFEEPSTLEYMVARLDGVGVERAKMVAEHFKMPTLGGSLRKMLNAGEKDWMAALGIRKGTKLAKSLIEVMKQ
jgi:ERCC4-type nuclease